MEKGEIEVGVVWDFNGLSYKAKMANPDDYVVLIPSDGSVISGYTTIINKYAKHPNAAKLTREYIFSDAGQPTWRGNARPIRAEHLKLPEDVKAKLLPTSSTQGHADQGRRGLGKTSKALPQKWNEKSSSK
jgi:putative spermidine/putrescine transport system substrate-binding protein